MIIIIYCYDYVVITQYTVTRLIWVEFDKITVLYMRMKIKLYHFDKLRQKFVDFFLPMNDRVLSFF